MVKPLVGVAERRPVRRRRRHAGARARGRGLAIGCGINPRYGDLDPYWMAAAAIDEAVRNVVAVGADPKRIAILDNFCWGNVNDPAVLGSLVRAAEACRDVALAFGTPFISGKDSLNNTYAGKAGERLDIPHTLLISALGRVPDVRKCVTMDLKEPGNDLYLVGVTQDELGGSHYHLVTGQSGGSVPQVDLELAAEDLRRGSRGDHGGPGPGVPRPERGRPGGRGGRDGVRRRRRRRRHRACRVDLPDEATLFSESPTRFLVEVKPENAAAFEECFAGLPLRRSARPSRNRGCASPAPTASG